jgi:hypothetical protein
MFVCQDPIYTTKITKPTSRPPSPQSLPLPSPSRHSYASGPLQALHPHDHSRFPALHATPTPRAHFQGLHPHNHSRFPALHATPTPRARPEPSQALPPLPLPSPSRHPYVSGPLPASNPIPDSRFPALHATPTLPSQASRPRRHTFFPVLRRRPFIPVLSRRPNHQRPRRLPAPPPTPSSQSFPRPVTPTLFAPPTPPS